MLVFIGILGPSMSTANGAMLVIAVVMARNVWQRWSEQEISDSKMLFLSRALALPTALAAGYIAYVRPEPGLLLAVAFDIAFAGCVIPLFLGVGTVARAISYFVGPVELAGLDTLLPPLLSAAPSKELSCDTP